MDHFQKASHQSQLYSTGLRPPQSGHIPGPSSLPSRSPGMVSASAVDGLQQGHNKSRNTSQSVIVVTASQAVGNQQTAYGFHQGTSMRPQPVPGQQQTPLFENQLQMQQMQVQQQLAAIQMHAPAGHQYICDYHKNYIQKLRLILPSGQVSYVSANHLGGPSGVQPCFPQFPQFGSFSPFVLDPSIQHSTASTASSAKPEDLSTTANTDSSHRGNGAPERSTSVSQDIKRIDPVEPGILPAPVDMRKTVTQENRHLGAPMGTSPEAESDADTSNEEFDGRLAPSDLLYGLGEVFTDDDLLGYIKHFDLDLPAHSSREELIRFVCEHMDSVPISDPKSTLTNLFHSVKTDSRAFNQPYKPPLSVDFDLSSDEEMLLVDGKDGIPYGIMSSSDLEHVSDSEVDDEMENGEQLPEIRFDAEMERALGQIKGGISVSDIARMLEKYSLPAKFSFINNRDTDTESSGSDESRRAKQDNSVGRKRPKLRHNGD